MVCSHQLCILVQYNQLEHLQLCIDNHHMDHLHLCILGEYNQDMDYLQLRRNFGEYNHHMEYL